MDPAGAGIGASRIAGRARRAVARPTRPQTDRRAGSPTDRRTGPPTDRPPGASTDRPPGSSTDGPPGSSTDRSAGLYTVPTPGSATDRVTGSPADRATGPSTDRSVDRPAADPTRSPPASRAEPVARLPRRGAAALAAIGLAALAAACSRPAEPPPGGDASPTVVRAHAEAARARDLSDPEAFSDAARGFVAAPGGLVRDAAGAVVWDYDAFAFVKGAAPPTVEPSLWRQALLNNRIGLFAVTDRIWQLRGFDLANMTLIRGDTGWIVVDALTSRETAAAAMAFARRHLGDAPVTAVVFTHSHVDHFGGALGVIDAQEAKARGVPVVAPAGFMEEATSENVLMGAAMARRSMYMYGSRLPRDPKGLVDNGLGKAVAYGRVGILAPTVTVEGEGASLVLDGLRFEFRNVPDSEAPAQFVFSIPALRAFCGAEIMGHTLHNLYTLRGAKVRDGLRWAGWLDASLRWSEGADVAFTGHGWPVWGRERIVGFIERQRDAYRYIHDQTVRLINAGLTGPEIAETLALPKALQDDFRVRGYYGTVRHNVKAVYQHYMGWYDAHPANLDPLPPLEAGRRYLALAGGADRVVEAARSAYDAGEFRWAAELLKHVVHAEPGHAGARELMARAFEQLGYLAESSAWRNAYLTGALEARTGPPKQGITAAVAADLLAHAPIERFLEAMAAAIDGPKAAERPMRIDLTFTDLGETWALRTSNGVLHFARGEPSAEAEATLKLTRPFFVRMMTGSAGAKELLLSDETRIEGSTVALVRFFGLLNKAPGTFPIVTRAAP
jgi:alkyl sulfatase BDS1-like metallo-beta-lactamase superfamily hydrolase